MKLEDTTIDIFNCLHSARQYVFENSVWNLELRYQFTYRQERIEISLIWWLYISVFELHQTTGSHTNSTEQFVTKIHEIVG